MKAAILYQQNSPLVVDSVEVPQLDYGQVLVKGHSSGICGKQLDEISGRQGPDPYLPHLLGHEGAGIVSEVGPGVKKVKPGDHVVLHWMKGSGIDSAPPRFQNNGTTISAGWVTTFSEYTVASENRVTPIPDSLPLDVASLLGCAVTTGLGIVFNDAGLKPGQTIAVFGVGGVGLNTVQGASLVNAHAVVAVDLHQRKLDLAREFGATHGIIGALERAKEQLMEISGGRGFDATVDTTGASSVRQLAYEVTSNRGTLVLAGVPHHEEKITIDSFPLHFGRRITGSHGGSTEPDVDIPRYIRLYEAGKLKLDQQITHRYSLNQINDAVNMVQSGQAGRCVVETGQA